MLPAQCFRIDPALLQRSQRGLIANENICSGDQLPQRFRSLRMIVIQRNRSFVAVRSQKVRRFAPDKRRSPASRLIAHSRPLNLDDIRPKIT